MPRRPRVSTGGHVYHVLNRAARGTTLFDGEEDYAAFEGILQAAPQVVPMRILAYCLLPNHWHLVLWPRRDGELSEYLRWVTVTHTQRRHALCGTAGTGPLYQGRFKSFPVQPDQHYLEVCKYAERNPLRARLVRKAESWQWSSLWHRLHRAKVVPLVEGPVPRTRNWALHVNQAQTPGDLLALRISAMRGAPFGDPLWQVRTAKKLALSSSLRPRGRPRKEAA
ncbi:MAG: transposase [Gemmataceae bacterium]